MSDIVWTPLTMPEYEREQLEWLISLVKGDYPSGHDAWTSAIVLESWLSNYRGTFYADKEAADAE